MAMRVGWTFELRSVVPAPPTEVWERVVTPEGINDEMRPWMTMSMPRAAAGLTVATIEVGRPIGRAWLRLFGLVPFDFDHLCLERVEAGRRFVEESTMVSMRRWRHERTVLPSGGGTEVTDRVTLEPRLPLRLLGPVLHRTMRAFFAHRHRRLRRHFGDLRS